MANAETRGRKPDKEKQELIPVGDLVKPSGLTPAQDRLWHHVTDGMPSEMMGMIDQICLEDLLYWYNLYLELVPHWKANPLDKEARIAAVTAYDRFEKLTDKFGMSPKSRSTIRRPKTLDVAESGMANLLEVLS